MWRWSRGGSASSISSQAVLSHSTRTMANAQEAPLRLVSELTWSEGRMISQNQSTRVVGLVRCSPQIQIKTMVLVRPWMVRTGTLQSVRRWTWRWTKWKEKVPNLWLCLQKKGMIYTTLQSIHVLTFVQIICFVEFKQPSGEHRQLGRLSWKHRRHNTFTRSSCASSHINFTPHANNRFCCPTSAKTWVRWTGSCRQAILDSWHTARPKYRTHPYTELWPT